jgi:hypothetical protein
MTYSKTIEMALSGCVDATGVRRNLIEHAKERGFSLAALSTVVGRNPAYLQQYVERGSPKVLPEDVRLRLAMALSIDERLLGARDPWTPPRA